MCFIADGSEVGFIIMLTDFFIIISYIENCRRHSQKLNFIRRPTWHVTWKRNLHIWWRVMITRPAIIHEILPWRLSVTSLRTCAVKLVILPCKLLNPPPNQDIFPLVKGKIYNWTTSTQIYPVFAYLFTLVAILLSTDTYRQNIKSVARNFGYFGSDLGHFAFISLQRTGRWFYP